LDSARLGMESAASWVIVTGITETLMLRWERRTFEETGWSMLWLEGEAWKDQGVVRLVGRRKRRSYSESYKREARFVDQHAVRSGEARRMVGTCRVTGRARIFAGQSGWL
jgi:hypothetical protein